MPDHRPASRTATPAPAADETQQQLRALGANAHQLHAAARAADHFNARDTADDRSTGSWLISTALALATELTGEIDDLARTIKDGSGDAALQAAVGSIRVRAYQLRAAARAADHFLDQPGSEDRETGGWLVATTVNLARRLADEIDNSGAPGRRREFVEADVIDPGDTLSMRRVAAAPPLRGAA